MIPQRPLILSYNVWCSFEQAKAALMQCCVADSEQVYQVAIPGQGSTPVQIDSGMLGNRAAFLFWNDGSNLVRIMPNNPQMTFAQGFPIYPQTGLILVVGPQVKHYGLCAAGLTSTITAIEVGVTQ